MKKQLGFIAFIVLSIMVGASFVDAATSDKTKKSSSSNSQTKCQEAMRSSYGKSYESLEKSVSKVSESLTSLNGIGVTFSTTTRQQLSGVTSRLADLKTDIADLLATSDANGQDCVKGTGDVHTKAVAVKAKISEIKNDLGNITKSTRFLNSALKGVAKYEGYVAKYEKYYTTINQKISGGGDKVTTEIRNYQLSWKQKIQEFKTDVADLKKLVGDLYVAGDHSNLNKIKLSLDTSVNSKNEKNELVKKVKNDRSALNGMYNNMQRLLINAGITVLGSTSTNKATGLTVDTATGELTN